MNMVVDPEPIRSAKWWVNFLPQVNLIKKKAETEAKEESKIATAEDEKLKALQRIAQQSMAKHSREIPSIASKA